MFLNNYGGCAIFMKEKTINVDTTDYRYLVNNRIVTLEEYISANPVVVVPVPTLE